MMLEQDEATRQVALNEMKKAIVGITDPATKANLEKAIRQLEVSNQPLTGQRRDAGIAPSAKPGPGQVVALSETLAAPGPAPRAETLWAKDPNRAYTEAVTRALVDAMIDFSAPIQLGPDQWLTVAARDDEARDMLAPPDPLEEVVTMIYRIKGSDLQEYRQGRIDRDEVRRRVQMSQF
jgi:hypothetical protein